MKLSLTRRTLLALLLGAVAFCGSVSHASRADDNFIILQSTTSTQDSGLFDHLLSQKTGIEVVLSRSAPDRPLRTRKTGTATWCWCTPSPTRKNSSPMAGASSVRM